MEALRTGAAALKLRVGVPSALARADHRSGHGRVWSATVAELRNHVRVVPVHVEKPTGTEYAVNAGRFDVWLANGHGGRPQVDVPVVAMVHEVGWTPDQLNGLDDSDSCQPIASRTGAGVAAASRVIAPSEASRRQVIERCGTAPGRVHCVPHGIDPAVFRPDLPGGRSLVARHARTGERPYVLFVGSLQLRKNLPSLRDAFGRLATAGYPHVLVVVANPPSPQFPSLSAEQAGADLPGAPGRVVMIPRPNDAQLAALMAGADAFCLPSLDEGFGLPALEAMACGAVVVVSDRGALPEVVGDAGIVVPPTPEAIEQALRRVLDRPEDTTSLRRRAILRGGRRSWADTARGWSEVLHLAAGDQQARTSYWRRVVRR